MAPGQGLEPRPPESESGVLPITPVRYMVIPAGFEPSISALKGRRPIRLVEGTMPALFPELGLFYAVTRYSFICMLKGGIGEENS